MAQLNPYLSFPNTCREAMNFYKDCLGGELFIQTVEESPEMAAQMPADMKDKILHSMLTSGAMVIMPSDLNQQKHLDGNTVQLCINCESAAQMESFFTKLAAGGKITSPVMDMPWGASFGALLDKYGKHWMLNFQKDQA